MSNNLSPNNQANSHSTQQVGQPPVQYLLVTIADYRYGVRLDTLQEVVRYGQLSVAPVPNSPEWLDGITSLRGNILSAVNLRAFLGLSRESASKTETNPLNLLLSGTSRSSPRLLVVFTPDLTIGVVVDDIEGVIFVQTEQIKIPEFYTARYEGYKADPAFQFLDGVYPDPEDKRDVALLNLRRLITSPQMLQLP